MDRYDVVVIGAGPGGYVAAARGAQLGAQVLLVERDSAGGVCLHRGCIPTKSLLSAAKSYAVIREAKALGIGADLPPPDLAAMRARAEKTVALLAGGIDGLLKKRKVSRLQGAARLAPNRRVIIEKAGGEALAVETGAVILATGSRPAEPRGLEADGEVVVTSDEMLKRDTAPERLAVVGGGAIGCEFASLYRMLGSAVTIIEMQPSILPGLDESIQKEMARAYKKRQVTLHVGDPVEGLERSGAGASIKLGSGKSVEADVVLVAVGRRPNVEGLGLEQAGVRLTDAGSVQVDGHARTNVEWIYAVGDVTGLWPLAHAASHQGIVAVEHALGHTLSRTIEMNLVPACVYSDPEVGTVGMSEARAAEAGGEIVTGTFPVRALGRAHAGGEIEGMFKVVAEKETGQLLGVHIVAHGASELIAAGTLALSHEATLESVARTIHAHPTYSEGLMEACEAALGRPIHG